VGVGSTKQGELPGRTADQIGVDALLLALKDCGLEKSDIDGLITCKSPGGFGIDTEVGRLAGLNPRYSATLDYGTCNFSLHLATMAIAAGMATTIALVYGTNQRSARYRWQTAAGSGSSSLEMHGFYNIAGQGAMAFNRHAYLYGTTSEQLGWVAVTQRENAQLNPDAVFQDDLSIDDYLRESYLVEPLRRSDVCMISDGGACLIVTSSDRVAATATTPVYVLSIDQATGLRQYQNPDNFDRPWISEMVPGAFERAGLNRTDIDLLYVQDPVSFWVLQMLELYGYCGPGESGPFVKEGRIRRNGEIPVNTNGGQLSESYMWGWLHLCEAVRQLRGTCGPRQVDGARFAQYCSTKGFEKAATSILGTEVPQ
jgi:acetyl-CoA acetyltransferase